MEVLYEQTVHDAEGKFEGYTPNYIKVVSEYIEDIEGQILSTKLLESHKDFMIGQIK
jgi:threonylcarbamoyladenosine tRNA methylthiotransferase MtaB